MRLTWHGGLSQGHCVHDQISSQICLTNAAAVAQNCLKGIVLNVVWQATQGLLAEAITIFTATIYTMWSHCAVSLCVKPPQQSTWGWHENPITWHGQLQVQIKLHHAAESEGSPHCPVLQGSTLLLAQQQVPNSSTCI